MRIRVGASDLVDYNDGYGLVDSEDMRSHHRVRGSGLGFGTASLTATTRDPTILTAASAATIAFSITWARVR